MPGVTPPKSGHNARNAPGILEVGSVIRIEIDDPDRGRAPVHVFRGTSCPQAFHAPPFSMAGI